MKIRLYADIEVTEEAETAVLAAAQLKVEARDGEPNGPDTLSEALVELLELIDSDGNVFDPVGFSYLTIDTISDIEETH